MIVLDFKSTQLNIKIGEGKSSSGIDCNFHFADVNNLDQSLAGYAPVRLSNFQTTSFTSALQGNDNKARVIKEMSFCNTDTIAHTFYIQLTDSTGAVYNILEAYTIPSLATLYYSENFGFSLINGSPFGTQFIEGSSDRAWRSKLFGIQTNLLTKQTAYFVFIGTVVNAIMPQFIRGQLTSNAAGTVQIENGLFSSPTVPSGSGQTLTKIVSTASLDTITSGATKAFKNSSAFATSVPAGTHLWAGLLPNFGTTQPGMEYIGFDCQVGRVLSVTTAGAFASNTTYSGALITEGSNMAPDLTVSLD